MRITQTAEKEKAIYEYYLARCEHYKQAGLLRDIRVSKLYEETADHFFLSAAYTSRIILKQIKQTK